MNVKILYKNKDLSPNQAKAARLLASGMTPKEVSIDVGVSVETLRLWRKKPRFQDYLNNTAQILEKEALTLIQGLNMQAIETIAELMKAESPPGVRLRTAQTVITLNKFSSLPLEEKESSGIEESVAVKIKDQKTVALIAKGMLEFMQTNQLTNGQASNANDVIDINTHHGASKL